jgi:hypothetical protein
MKQSDGRLKAASSSGASSAVTSASQIRRGRPGVYESQKYGRLVPYFRDSSEWRNDEGAQCRGVGSSLSDVTCMLLKHGMIALLHPLYKLCKALQCADSGLPDVIETALKEQQGKFLDNSPCTKEGSHEDVHPERAGSSCGNRFENLVDS